MKRNSNGGSHDEQGAKLGCRLAAQRFNEPIEVLAATFDDCELGFSSEPDDDSVPLPRHGPRPDVGAAAASSAVSLAGRSDLLLQSLLPSGDLLLIQQKELIYPSMKRGFAACVGTASINSHLAVLCNNNSRGERRMSGVTLSRKYPYGLAGG